MKKINYSINNQQYSISQLRSVPEYLGLIETDAYFKEVMQEGIKYVLDSIDINKAEGFLLNYIGWLVGTDRGFFDITRYFCYNRADVNTEKYFFFSKPTSPFVVPGGTLEDQNFRSRIRAKAGANTSKCTREENINIIKNMTFANKVIIKNVDTMILDITIKGANLFITNTIREDIENILGNGVGIRNLVTEE